jgi:hypothetical protein
MTTHPETGRSSWRNVRHYAYAERPFGAAWARLATQPHEILGGEAGPAAGIASVELRAHRGGLDLSRTVSIRFGGLVCDDDIARMALRWQDSRHAVFFPVFEGVLSLAPIQAGRHQVTQVGLVGRYRPPLGAAGVMADRLAGGELVADETIAAFVENVANRLEALIEPEADGSDGDVEEEPDPGHSRVMVTVDGLGDRRGGAVAVARQLSGTPGVTHAEVNPIAGIATVEYDPDTCNLSRILAELEIESDG